MAEQKIILGNYVIYEENDYWTCRSCEHRSNGRPYRMIAHLTRNPGKGIKICPKITAEQVEDLKRELGLGPDLTGADGQQPQQPGENDDIRQENGNKKRKGASGSGTSGSNQREAEMSLLGASNPSGALNESIPSSDGNIWSLDNLEISLGATGLRLDNLEHNSPFSVSNLSVFPPETSDALLTVAPGSSRDRERAYVPNTDNGGFQGTNAVGSSVLFDITHQGQSSSQGQADHWNDQQMHPYTSPFFGIAFGVERASEIVFADEPQPPCPRGFNPDLWEFYLEIDPKIDGLSGRKFTLYEECIPSTDGEERKVLLGFLESACSEVRNFFTSFPDSDRSMLRHKLRRNFYGMLLLRRLHPFNDQVDRVEEIKNKIREETKEGDEMLLRKRKNDTKRWVGYAARFKSDVDDLNVAARKVKSLEEILQLLSRANELTKIGDVVIATGLSLLHPVPKDILSWNPTYVSCGSQLVNHNQMPPTQFTPQV